MSNENRLNAEWPDHTMVDSNPIVVFRGERATQAGCDALTEAGFDTAEFLAQYPSIKS